MSKTAAAGPPGRAVTAIVDLPTKSRGREQTLRSLARDTANPPAEIITLDRTRGDFGTEDSLYATQVGPVRTSRTLTPDVRSLLETVSSPLVLFVKSPVRAIEPNWLDVLVEALTSRRAAVAPRILVRGRRRLLSRAPVISRETRLQRCSSGLRVTTHDERVDFSTAPPIGGRTDLQVSSSCFLARRSDVIAALAEGVSRFGYEFDELPHLLAPYGSRSVESRSTVLMMASQADSSAASSAGKKADGWQGELDLAFNERFGARLHREVRLEVTSRAPLSRVREPRRLLISAQRRDPIADHLTLRAEQAGWVILREDDGRVQAPVADVAIALQIPEAPHPFFGHDITAAFISDHDPRWNSSGSLDSADHVLVADPPLRARMDATWARGLAQVAHPSSLLDVTLESARKRTMSSRIGVSTAAPSWSDSAQWGDTLLARGLIRAFRRLGHESREIIRSDWRSSRATSCDVMIHLRGLQRRRPALGQTNILWVISHPDRIALEEFDDYDHVCVASQKLADELSVRLARPIHFVPQATDADTFGLRSVQPQYETPILYVGIARVPSRPGPRWLYESGRQFDLYGPNWEQRPEGRMLRDSFIPNRELASAYRSADIVVADHHGSMRDNGFVANRIFDVLASGGVPVSDRVDGIDELFDGLIPTYSSRVELDGLLDALLDDDSTRCEISKRGERLVRQSHTLDHRARQFLDILQSDKSSLA